MLKMQQAWRSPLLQNNIIQALTKLSSTGTMVMDLLLMGALSAFGLPPLACFSIVGNTVGRLFSMLGNDMVGGVPMGVTAHYLIGPIVGAILGAVVARVDTLRLDTVKKGILLAALYVEIISQPILATTPILLKMTGAETLQWFAGSFVMHLIFGAVLGVVTVGGLRWSVTRDDRSFLAKLG